jgi:hypothetical protein
MNSITTDQLRRLQTPPSTPCVSIYQPTHRRHPENQQDSIRFRNLVDTVEKTLGNGSKSIVASLRQIESNRDFWMHTLDGLAVLATQEQMNVFSIPRTVPELAVVTDSFHIKPLLRHVQSADRFFVLSLSRVDAHFFEGNRYQLNAVPDALPTFAEAVGTELQDSSQRTRLAEGGRNASTGHYSGHGGRKDELDVDSEKWFKAIRNALKDLVNPSSRVPVVVAALPDNASEFLKVADHGSVMQEFIPLNPESQRPEQLLAAAWKIVEPNYLQRLEQLVNDFNVAQSRQQGTGDISDACQAVLDGRIGVLLVDADQQIRGRIDAEKRTFHLDGATSNDDILDDIAERTLQTGGDVVVVPSDRMPTKTGLAAILRF